LDAGRNRERREKREAWAGSGFLRMERPGMGIVFALLDGEGDDDGRRALPVPYESDWLEIDGEDRDGDAEKERDGDEVSRETRSSWLLAVP
jgi:hypothetical protein